MRLYGKILKSGLIGAAFLCLVSGGVQAVNPFKVKEKGDRVLALLQERAGRWCSVEAILPKIQKVKPLGDAGKLDEADALLDDILDWFAKNPCGDHDTPPLPDTPVNNEWGDDQAVTIKGYAGDAMEPFISRDGKYLFFNDEKTADKEKDIFWAKRIDDTTFDFMGPVENVNSNAVDGVPSMDDSGRFFFMSAKNYSLFDQTTVFNGIFENGAVKNIIPQPDLSLRKAGWLNMDIEVSADGNRVYSTQTYFGNGPPPTESYFFFGSKVGDQYIRDLRSEKIFASINKDKVVYAAALSRDELEIFYTRLLPGMRLSTLTARRESLDEPFGEPEVIGAITGFAEAPALSADETMLYYHKRNEKTGKFEIRVLRRKG